MQKTETDFYSTELDTCMSMEMSAVCLHTYLEISNTLEKLHFSIVMLVEDFFFFLWIPFDCNSTKYLQLTLMKMNVGNRRKLYCRAVWGLGGWFFSFLKAWCLKPQSRKSVTRM